jgi:hypothetical protein
VTEKTQSSSGKKGSNGSLGTVGSKCSNNFVGIPFHDVFLSVSVLWPGSLSPLSESYRTKAPLF